jgi:uncharacterized membrane protein YfcA
VYTVTPQSAWKRGWNWAFKPIAPRFSMAATAAILFTSNVIGGVLDGMLGIGGPPKIAAFAILNLGKETQRGVQSLGILTGAAVRLISLKTASTTIYHSELTRIYVIVSCLAVVGTTIGAIFRTKVSTEWILRCLYVLIILSTFTMFNVLSKWYFVLIYCICIAGYFAALAVMWWWPLHHNFRPWFALGDD